MSTTAPKANLITRAPQTNQNHGHTETESHDLDKKTKRGGSHSATQVHKMMTFISSVLPACLAFISVMMTLLSPSLGRLNGNFTTVTRSSGNETYNNNLECVHGDVRQVLRSESCVCDCGWWGSKCEEKLVPTTYNMVGGLLLPIGFICLSIYALHRIGNVFRGDANCWTRPSAQSRRSNPCTESFVAYVTPERLLKFRASCLVFFFIAFLYFIFVRLGGVFYIQAAVAFTIWNYILILGYFGLSTYLSLDRVRNGPRTDQRLCTAERVHWVMIQVELPSALFITVMVLTVLLPLAVTFGHGDKLLHPFSFVSHVCNSVLILADFLLSGHYITRDHFFFKLIWASLYLMAHSLLMLAFQLSGHDHCPIYPLLTMHQWAFIPMLFALFGVIAFFYKMALSISDKKYKTFFSQHHVHDSDAAGHSNLSGAIQDGTSNK